MRECSCNITKYTLYMYNYVRLAPGTYDPKYLDTSPKVTIRKRLQDFKPDSNPGTVQATVNEYE